MASSEKRITAYRIVAPRWVDTAFSGDGAQKFGGRWNSPGRRVVYLANSRALAALETLVHLTTPGSRAKAFVIIPTSIPITGVISAEITTEPRATGDPWITNRRSLALRVPSAIVPGEFNFLLNPSHPDFSKIEAGDPQPFGFDDRLWP
ncbi:RES domain-containing protein [Haloferula helveola]|uniref:RES domain-containing protein n=1 Tax=Haloferula helveola TaxID=490095 RepID=A0ABM7R8Z9_9BACT|nr:RES domain-containing protein [Haloferula helveola]